MRFRTVYSTVIIKEVQGLFKNNFLWIDWSQNVLSESILVQKQVIGIKSFSKTVSYCITLQISK